MSTRDDLIEATIAGFREADGGGGYYEGSATDFCVDGRLSVHKVVDAILDALISRVPSVCPSGFDWTTGDIEDWLRSVKEGRA